MTSQISWMPSLAWEIITPIEFERLATSSDNYPYTRGAYDDHLTTLSTLKRLLTATELNFQTEASLWLSTLFYLDVTMFLDALFEVVLHLGTLWFYGPASARDVDEGLGAPELPRSLGWQREYDQGKPLQIPTDCVHRSALPQHSSRAPSATISKMYVLESSSPLLTLLLAYSGRLG